MNITRRPSYRLTYEDAIHIWDLYLDGWFQNRIAAKFDINPGRVNEIVKGHKFPAAEDDARSRRERAA